MHLFLMKPSRKQSIERRITLYCHKVGFIFDIQVFFSVSLCCFTPHLGLQAAFLYVSSANIAKPREVKLARRCQNVNEITSLVHCCC